MQRRSNCDRDDAAGGSSRGPLSSSRGGMEMARVENSPQNGRRSHQRRPSSRGAGGPSNSECGVALNGASRSTSAVGYTGSGDEGLSRGTAGPHTSPRRGSSRHSSTSSRHGSRHGSNVSITSGSSHRPGQGRRNGEQSDYASDASAGLNGSPVNPKADQLQQNGPSLNGKTRSSRRSVRDQGPVDPKQDEQRKAQRALKQYSSAFKFENGRDPVTDEDWHPMRRTRGVVRGGNAHFPAPAPAGAEGGKAAAQNASPGLDGQSTPGPLGDAPATKPSAAARADAPKKPPEKGLRGSMRTCLSKPKIDFAMLIVVLLYGLFVFVDMGIGERAAGWWRNTWAKALDSLFLLIFVIELVLKLFAFGPAYLTKSPLSMVDAFAIFLCAGLFVAADLFNGLDLVKRDEHGASRPSAEAPQRAPAHLFFSRLSR